MARCLNCIHYDVCDGDRCDKERMYGECSYFLHDADVVPRAEVEHLKEELAIWKQNRFNLFQRLECYEMTRQKVAGEVIDEIFLRIRNEFSISELGKSALNQLEADLKKKYTEGQK